MKNESLNRLMQEMSKKKAPKKIVKDIIVDPMGQWAHPGENTRIPSNKITMKGVPYPVKGIDNNGFAQMMFPNEQYDFPGAHYVDEYPQLKNGGNTHDIECPNCGWSWNYDKSDPNPMLCHKCGEMANFQPGGQYGYPQYQPGGSTYVNPGGSTYVNRPQRDMRTLAEAKADEARALHAKILSQQPTLQQASSPINDERRRQLNEQYARQSGKRYNQQTGAVEDRFTPQQDRMLNRAYYNIVEPMIDAEMVASAAPLVGKGAKAAGKYLTEETALKNAYKLNPYAFKPNETNWYRQVGKSAIDDAFNTGIVREAGEEVSPRMLQEFQDQLVRMQGSGMDATLAGRRPASPFFAKGELFYPMGRKPTINKVTGKLSKNPAGKGSADYLIETALPNESFQPAYVKGMALGVPTETGTTAILKPDPSLRNLENFNIYQKDWLKGYKEIPKKKQGGEINYYDLQNINNNKMRKGGSTYNGGVWFKDGGQSSMMAAEGMEVDNPGNLLNGFVNGASNLYNTGKNYLGQVVNNITHTDPVNFIPFGPILPANVKALGRMTAANLGFGQGVPFLQKSDFTSEQLKSLQTAAINAKKRTGMNAGSMKYSDYGKKYSDPWSNKHLLLTDPTKVAQTSIGRFTYGTDNKGNVNVSDKYNFYGEDQNSLLALIIKKLDKNLDYNDKRRNINFNIKNSDIKKNGGLFKAGNGSIVEYLASRGEDYSKKSRAKLAAQKGIKNYDYSSKKNLELLRLLQNEKQDNTDSSTRKKIPNVQNEKNLKKETTQKFSEYVDLQKLYNLDPYSKEGVAKAREIAGIYPKTKFVCTAEGCAEIALNVADSYGQNFSRGNAWDIGNKNKVVVTNPEYANEIGKSVLHDPTSFKADNNMYQPGSIIALNRKNNRKGDMATTRANANDSYDYANQTLYPKSRGNEHVGYMLDNKTMLHGTGAGSGHPGFYTIDDVENGISLPGYGGYQPVETIIPGGALASASNWLSNLFKQDGGTYSNGVYYQGGGHILQNYMKETSPMYNFGGYFPQGPRFDYGGQYLPYPNMNYGTPNISEMKEGGIHINPSKRGTFTAAASKHGKSVQGFASQVLANKQNYSPAMVKKANFARNASKWKHESGGLVNGQVIDVTPDMLEQLKAGGYTFEILND